MGFKGIKRWILVDDTLDYWEFTWSTFLSHELKWSTDTIWIGDVKNQSYSEPFLVTTISHGEPALNWNFTSYHGSEFPILFTFYLGQFSPIIFLENIPGIGAHGTPFQPGEADIGFGIGVDGYIEWHGSNNFTACQTPEQEALLMWQIFFDNNGAARYGLTCTDNLYVHIGLGECGCNNAWLWWEMEWSFFSNLLPWTWRSLPTIIHRPYMYLAEALRNFHIPWAWLTLRTIVLVLARKLYHSQFASQDDLASCIR